MKYLICYTHDNGGGSIGIKKKHLPKMFNKIKRELLKADVEFESIYIVSIEKYKEG